MFDKARFEIIGRVGKIKSFDKVVRVSIATNASYKDDRGDWVDRTAWNEVVIFNRNTCKYVADKVATGEVVRVEGTLRQSTYERDGETIYTTELVVEEFSRQPARKAASEAEAAGK